MAYPKPAFKKVKLNTPYLIRFEHDVKLGLLNYAGHYLFRAVIEFRSHSLGAINSVRVITVENRLPHSLRVGIWENLEKGASGLFAQSNLRIFAV